MTKTSLFSKGQSWFHEAARLLGHDMGEGKGVCQGVSCAALEAMLTHNMSRFNKVAEQLALMQTKKSITKKSILPITFFQKKLTKTPCEENKLFASPGSLNFIKKTLAYQKLKLKRQKFSSHRSDGFDSQITRLSKHVGSSSILEQDGMAHVKTIFKRVSASHLVHFLHVFQKQYIKDDSKPPLAFLLTSGNHAVALSYNTKLDCWQLVNPSSMPTKNINLTSELVDKIFRCFGHSTDGNHLPLKFRVFSTAAHVENAKTCVARWRSKYKSTQVSEPQSAANAHDRYQASPG